MRIAIKCLAGLVLLVAAAPGRATAQNVPRGLVEVREGNRAGFWAGLGLGAGGQSEDLRDGFGYGGQLYEPTVSLRLGGTVNQHLRLGGEALSWINEQGRRTETLSSFLLIAQYYPLADAGLYLKGGAGVGRNAVDFNDGFGIGDTGFAGLLGAGWEFRLGRKVYLNPAVDLVQQWYSGQGGARYRERVVNFGLGVLFQSRP